MNRLWISAAIRVPENKSLEAAQQALQVLVKETRNEPGCFQFDLLQDNQDPRRFLLWECFADQAALDEHFRLAHTLAYLEQGHTEVEYAEKLTHLL